MIAENRLNIAITVKLFAYDLISSSVPQFESHCHMGFSIRTIFFVLEHVKYF